MPFNSIDFAIFLPIVFMLYWFVTNKHLKTQNGLILIASYTFYGWWDRRFLLLLLVSSLVDYSVGRGLMNQNNPIKRKFYLSASIIVNLGLLLFFKYFNFFIDNFIAVFTLFGQPIKANSLNIILPIGISFYTLKTLNYSIDVYKRKLEPTKDLIAYLSFVSFFPQILAGPIERATTLLPQFYKERTFDYSKAVDGLKQILWGLFKKIVIADNFAVLANTIFTGSTNYSGSTLVFGVLFFSFQIYCDFSGYSDIAIGVSRLLGFDTIQNFAFPYFSRNITEFWRRWHISLSTWLRDYIFLPLAFFISRKLPKDRYLSVKSEQWIYLCATLITFFICGLWHGARWTFVIWGLLHGIYLTIGHLLRNQKLKFNKKLGLKKNSIVCNIFDISFTFILVSFGWIFFRAESIGHALSYISKIFSSSLFSIPYFPGIGLTLIAPTVLFVIIEWLGREQTYAIAHLGIKLHRSARWAMYYVIILAILYFSGKQQQFVYFQF